MLVDFKNICFNATLNIVRGKGSLQQSTFAWGEGFHGSPLAVMCLYPPKLSLWLISRERNICPFAFFSPSYVWAAVRLHGEGAGSHAVQNTGSQAKWNCSELAGSYFLRVMSGRRWD